MSEPEYPEERLASAIEALADRERFREAEALVSRAAPQLQRVLNQALSEGGWFGESHEEEVRKAVAPSDADERQRLTGTLLAEETRIGMLVGVAVGWALREELSKNREEDE